MHLRPSYHAGEYSYGRAPAGRSTAGPELTVAREDDGSGVTLTLEPLPAETFDDRDVIRTLTPDEARELAAMLWHHANEQERRYPA